jgi:hypothetical protein
LRPISRTAPDLITLIKNKYLQLPAGDAGSVEYLVEVAGFAA